MKYQKEIMESEDKLRMFGIKKKLWKVKINLECLDNIKQVRSSPHLRLLTCACSALGQYSEMTLR